MAGVRGTRHYVIVRENQDAVDVVDRVSARGRREALLSFQVFEKIQGEIKPASFSADDFVLIADDGSRYKARFG